MSDKAQPDKDAMIQAGRMLEVDEVLRMWPISREYLSRPCVMFGRKPMYPFDELMWYRDKHRYTPKRKVKK
jgi:hypothetical protein